MFGLEGRKGVVAAGADADLVVYDPSAKHTISAKTHHMDVDYSTYEGREITGRADAVMSRGKVIVDGDEWLGAAGDGRFLKRAPTGAPAGPDLIGPARLLAPRYLPTPEDQPVNRYLILVALLAIFLAACGTQTADQTDATLTPEPTPAPATDAPDEDRRARGDGRRRRRARDPSTT